MSGKWTFLLHEDALDVLDAQRGLKRRNLRAAFSRLVKQPFTPPNREISAPRERIYSVIAMPGFEIVYWLDLRVRQVCITRIIVLSATR